MAEAIKLKRGLIIEVNLDPMKDSETGKIRPCVVVTNNTYNQRVPVIQVVPITAWSEKKAKIKSNVEIEPSERNGLTKKSIADCLQTRPIDYSSRGVSWEIESVSFYLELDSTNQPNLIEKKLIQVN